MLCKCCSIQRFGEDIHNLLFSWNEPYLQGPIHDMFSEEVIFYIQMFHSWMHLWDICKFHSTSIIFKDLAFDGWLLHILNDLVLLGLLYQIYQWQNFSNGRG